MLDLERARSTRSNPRTSFAIQLYASCRLPFDQPPNVATITTVNVLERGAPILVVLHYDDDDSWAFLCETTYDEGDGRVIGMRAALRLDPALREIADLLPGWRAERAAVSGPWRRAEDRAARA